MEIGLNLAITRRGGGAAVLIARETFTAADATTLAGRTMDSGHVWTVVTGVWQITSNQGRLVTPSGNNKDVVQTNIGVANCRVQAVIPVRGDNPRVIARYVDANNFIMANFGNATTVTIFKLVANVFTEIASGAHTFAANDVLALECRGDTLQAVVNGVVKASATDAAHNTATRCGIGAIDGVERFDVWEVYG